MGHDVVASSRVSFRILVGHAYWFFLRFRSGLSLGCVCVKYISAVFRMDRAAGFVNEQGWCHQLYQYPLQSAATIESGVLTLR